jgi:hypothetical protein
LTMVEDEEATDPQAQRRALQDLKRQVMRKVDGITDPFLLQSILEMIEDAEGDLMDGNQDPEEIEAAESRHEHPDNRKLPPPVNKPPQNTLDNWLDGLGR